MSHQDRQDVLSNRQDVLSNQKTQAKRDFSSTRRSQMHWRLEVCVTTRARFAARLDREGHNSLATNAKRFGWSDCARVLDPCSVLGILLWYGSMPFPSPHNLATFHARSFESCSDPDLGAVALKLEPLWIHWGETQICHVKFGLSSWSNGITLKGPCLIFLCFRNFIIRKATGVSCL